MIPRAAHIADDLPLLHPLAGHDTDAGTVGVQRVKRSIMLYLYVIPIASAPQVGRVCNCHRAAVVGYFACKRVGAISKL